MAQIDIQRALRDAEFLRDLGHTQLPLAIEGVSGQGSCLGLPGESSRTPAEAATRSCRGQSRMGPLPDEVALELGQRSKHVEHQFPGARRRIELFLEALKANAALRQVRDDLDEMAQ